MIEGHGIIKCEICGNILENLFEGGGPVVCCGQKVKVVTANTTDAAKEKHVPVIEKIPGGYKVSVGSALHPMEEKHYIMWIELVADGLSLRKFLKPGDLPVAEFKCDATEVAAREYCNLHGLWRAAA
ncbi:MAG: desulfoferrodoxin [Candidatus Adiutrix sp.]|jgi:superoxide reductase|nr:desulfoferrodoxin [Candidatus Adiutrix sp.]